MLFPWRNHEVNIIFSHGFKFCIDYDAEAGGKVLLNEMHIETVCLLSKLSEAKNHISVKVEMDEMDLTAAESKATYQKIQD